MIKYESFQYIYPPRPKNPIPPSDLKIWDNGMMIAQPKVNGTNCTIYLNGKEIYVFNRHGQRLSNFHISKDEIMSLYRGTGWMVLNGEYTNKGKLIDTGVSFSDKFCLFDILVQNSNYLIGTTFEHRINLMGEFYGDPRNTLHQISENVFLVKSFYSNFVKIYDDLTKIDLMEGLVLKRRSSKLEIGSSENNNSKSQIKVRKPTKNYKF